MASRGQFVRSTDQRWKIDLDTFISSFEESSHPKATHLLYEIQWRRNPNTFKNFCTNDPPDHAEIYFLENECDVIRQRNTTPCSITWYLSWSPCGRCSRAIIEFLDEHPRVTLEIRVARLYKHDDERNQQGLRNLDQSGVKIAIMDPDDFYYCWRTFVAHQRSGVDYWQFLQHLYSEDLYSFYSEELDWILEQS